MLKGYLVFVFVFFILPFGQATSLLCGSTRDVEIGSSAGAGTALALALIRPPTRGQHEAPAPCVLRVAAPDAAAFSLRLIDVKPSLPRWELASRETQNHAMPVPKWSARNLELNSPNILPEPVINSTDLCKMFVYVGDAEKPIWQMSLCGLFSEKLVARTGAKLLPPKVKIVWNPPAALYQRTEDYRLVVTAVNSGAVCTSDSQFNCGMTSLCISSYLICDGVRHCPGGEDEVPSACKRRHDPVLLEVLRRFAATNQELLGLDQANETTKPSVIMKISEGEQKSNPFMEFAAALKPYGPWSYLVVGMLICATILMFCLAWECCCKRSKPSETPISIPASCIDLSPAITVTGASQHLFAPPTASPPEYEAPPTYSSLFPRAFKCEEPVPQCSSQPD